ncbi:MAG TPA: SIMPL domain-containing protein [Patescibacteria group bacterium]
MAKENDQNDKMKKNFYSSLSLLALVLVILAGVNIRNDWKAYDYIGQSPEFKNQISITGQGKVMAIPDIASTVVGIRTENRQVAVAQKENAEKMNQLIKKIKEAGVADEDLKTVNYNIFPIYDYLSDRGQVLRGYEVSQNLEVKIRDLEKIGQILAIAAAEGANQVSGLNFTIDDEEVYRQQARELALANAREKAEALAKTVNIKLGKVVSFSETGSAPPPAPLRAYAEFGVGGAADVALPEIEAGSQEIVIIATISFEIL